MARYEQHSVGAGIYAAIAQRIAEQNAQRRQSTLDGIAMDDRMRAIAREDALARRQATQDANANADRLAGIMGPSSDLSPEQAAALRAGGYTVADQTTLPARGGMLDIPSPMSREGLIAQTFAQPPADTSPLASHLRDTIAQEGQARQAQQAQAKLRDIPAAPYSRRDETYTEQQARQVRDEAVAEKNRQREDAQAFAREQADANRASAKERSDADRQMRETIAHMSNSNSVETRALGNQLKQLQIQAQQDKLDAARSDRGRAEKERIAGRTDVRDLAQSILDDPSLSSITGALDARTPNLLPGSVDVQARLDQLKNKLSLAGRSQMKGQGQISDFEGRMLASAMTAIDPRAGSENVKKYLRQIIDVMGDDNTSGNSGNTRKIGRFDVVEH